MLRTGKPYLRDSDDDKPNLQAAGGAAKQQPAAQRPPDEDLNGTLMETVRAMISEQFSAMRAELLQPVSLQRGSGVFSSPDTPRQTAPDHVPPTISLSDYLGRSPELNRYAGLAPQLNLQAPPPFGKRLLHLRDVFTYWTFLNDYKEYKLQNPHVASTMRIVQYIPQEILFGQLDLQQEIENKEGSLLDDRTVHDRIAMHFSMIISTPRQFLQTMESIPPPAVAFDTNATDVHAATLPLLQYLQKLYHFYGLCASMCPAAIPREDDYDRTNRTTVKFIVNRALAEWWPWWKTDIWPSASKLRERTWPNVHAHIDSAVRTLVARFNSVHSLMESWRAFDGKSPHRPQGERNEHANRRLLVRTGDSPQRNGNWNSPTSRQSNDVRKSDYRPFRADLPTTGGALTSPERNSFQRHAPPPNRVHLLEDNLSEDDDYHQVPTDGHISADTSDTDTPLPDADPTLDALAAMAPAATSKICFRAMNEGTCPNGATCKFSHAKPLYGEYAKELIRKYS